MINKFLFDDAEVQIVMQDGGKIAIFDVSPTVYCEWIAIGVGGNTWLLEKLKDTRSMLEYCAKKQIGGATVVEKDDVLRYFSQGDGFDSWNDFVNDVHADMERRSEFPAYTDAQGNEHAEF